MLNSYIFDRIIKNTISTATGEDMRKYKIPSIPPTTNKTIRFPNDVIEQVEEEIRGQNCTFSAFVIEAVRLALESLHEDEE